MIALLIPAFALRLDTSDAGNDPANHQLPARLRHARAGFRPGFNGPLTLVAEVRGRGQAAALAEIRLAALATPDVGAATEPRLSPSGRIGVIQVYPDSAPQASATTELVNTFRHRLLPPIEQRTGIPILVGGATAGSIDFSHVLSSKLCCSSESWSCSQRSSCSSSSARS